MGLGSTSAGVPCQDIVLACLQGAAEGVFVTDQNEHIVWVNQSFTDLTGYSPQDVLGGTPWILRSGAHTAAFYAEMWKTLRGGRHWKGDVIHRRKDGSLFEAEVSVTPIRNAAGTVTNYIVIQRVINESKSLPAGIEESEVETTHQASSERERSQIQTALQDSNARYQSLFENAGDGIVLIDVLPGEVFVITDVNPAYERISGRHRAAVIGRRSEEVVSPARWAILIERYRTCIRERQPFTCEETRQYPNRVARCISQTIPIPNAAGEIARLAVFIRDLTARIQMEEELRSKEEQLRLVLEATRDGIWDWDVPSGKVRVSPRFAEILGCAPTQEFLTIDEFKALIDPENGSVAQHVLDENLLAGDSYFEIEHRVQSAGGQLKWVLQRGRAVWKDGNGRPIRLTGTLTDITDRKIGEERIRASEERNRSVIASIAEGILIQDRTGHITACNAAAERILGLSERELIQQSIEAFEDHGVHEPGSPVSACRGPAMKTMESGMPCSNVPVVVSHRDGTQRWLSLNSEPLCSTDGKAPDGVVTSITDITKERRNLEELLAARIAAEAATRAKGEFLACMSHEIRTPIHGVLGLAQLALSADSMEESRVHMETLYGAAEGLLNIINSILDFSKIEAGKLELEDIPFSLHQVIEEAEKLFAHQAVAKGLRLDCNVSSEIPHLLSGDPARLRQILLNLLGNAIKFTSSGAITVEVAPVSSKTAGQMIALHFKVTDTGSGIPQELQDSIFRAFEQADSSVTRKHGGTGLGLAICSRLVKLMGGEIWVESVIGAGSTFHFTGLFRPAGENSRMRLSECVSELERPMRILVAEDNIVNQSVAATMLAKRGHQVSIASTGREALDLWKAGEFDVIFMDNHMPEMGGLEAVRTLRARELAEGRRRVPVIALTASALAGDRERFLEAGMDGYLAKPFRADDLHSILTRLKSKAENSK